LDFGLVGVAGDGCGAGGHVCGLCWREGTDGREVVEKQRSNGC
jgi:hypothetical protein